MYKKFKDWIYENLLSEMTEREAEQILDSRKGDPELGSKYRTLALKHHPDRGGDVVMMKKITQAYEILSSLSSSNPQPKYQGETGPFRGNPSWSNLDYCKYMIQEKSKKSGSVTPYSFWAWDGDYFRGSFTVLTNPANFDFSGEVMEKWNSSPPSSYKTKAVFVSLDNNEILLVRLNSKSVISHDLVYGHDSFNQNPGNDSDLVNRLREDLPE